LILENKWRAQRYGVEAQLGDFGKRKAVPLPELIDELVELLRPHAQDLGCLQEVERAREIAQRGSSSDQQLRIYQQALSEGASDREAQMAVVDWLIAESVPSASAQEAGRDTGPESAPGTASGAVTDADNESPSE
jgi:carboxylate-amine ligase